MLALRLAVFDLDGTLIDSERNIVAAMTEAWAKLGLGRPRPEAVRRIIGLSLVEACAALLPDESQSTHHHVAETYKDAFRALRRQPDTLEPLFPGVIEALDRLDAAGWLLGIATGKSRPGVQSVLEAHNLGGRFVTMQTADDNPGKPHPAMLLRAAAETGTDSDNVVMIGDTAYDMKMAAAAKMAGLGVSWGCHPPHELLASGARVVIDSFDALSDTLARLSPAFA